MFFLKKFVSAFLLPMPVFFALAAAGFFLLRFSKRRKAGGILVAVATVWLALFSWSPATDSMLAPLERAYPPAGQALAGMEDKPRYVAVLGGGHTSDPQVPPTGRLSSGALTRLAEGIRLHRTLPGSKLILSGGGYMDPVSNARAMADVAVALGVDRENLVLEERPLDTETEAKLIGEIVGQRPFVLVTSAYHMKRAVGLFEKVGAEPVPAPTGHRVKRSERGRSWRSWFPSADSLRNAEAAIHEYLGIAWSKMRGKI